MSTAPLAIRALRRALDGLLVALIASVVVTVLFTRVVPFLTGGTTMVVAGASMEPSIPMGAVVYDAPVAARDLRPGDVVSIRVGPERAIFTHRVTRLVTLPDGAYLETRGDANPAVDPSLVPVTAVIGRTTIAIPFLGFAVAVLSTAQGVVLLLAVAGILLAGAWLLESLEEERLVTRRRGASQPGSPFAFERASELDGST